MYFSVSWARFRAECVVLCLNMCRSMSGLSSQGNNQIISEGEWKTQGCEGEFLTACPLLLFKFFIPCIFMASKGKHGRERKREFMCADWLAKSTWWLGWGWWKAPKPGARNSTTSPMWVIAHLHLFPCTWTGALSLELSLLPPSTASVLAGSCSQVEKSDTVWDVGTLIGVLSLWLTLVPGWS